MLCDVQSGGTEGNEGAGDAPVEQNLKETYLLKIQRKIALTTTCESCEMRTHTPTRHRHVHSAQVSTLGPHLVLQNYRFSLIKFVEQYVH